MHSKSLKLFVSKVKKTGLSINHGHSERCFYVNGPKNVLSWYVQGDKAVCIHIAQHGDKSDAMRDYHAGFFPGSVQAAINYLLEA